MQKEKKNGRIPVAGGCAQVPAGAGRHHPVCREGIPVEVNKIGEKIGPGEEILLSLNTAFPVLRKLYGVLRIGIFGSLARGGGTHPGVPVIEVEFEPGQETYANYVALLFDLEGRLHRRVELVTTRVLTGFPHPDPGGESDEEVLLDRILTECTFIITRTWNLTKDQFVRDEVLRRGAMESLEVIAMAVALLPHELKTGYPGIRWREIAAIPSGLLHTRFGPDPVIVWTVLNDEIPALESQVRKILRI